jgi:hypothetical protein
MREMGGVVIMSRIATRMADYNLTGVIQLSGRPSCLFGNLNNLRLMPPVGILLCS